MAHEFESLSRDRMTAHFVFSGPRGKVWHGGGYGQEDGRLYSARDLRAFPEFAAPVTAEPLRWTNEAGQEVETDHFAIVRHAPDGTNRAMIVVSDRYDLAHHLDDAKTIQEHIWGDDEAEVWETAGGLRGFQRFFASAPLADEAEVAKDDPLLLRLVFDTGYGRKRRMRLTTVRPVCANTLAIGESRAVASAFAQRHIGQSTRNLKAAADSLRQASEVFDSFIVEARAMRKIELRAGAGDWSLQNFFAKVAEVGAGPQPGEEWTGEQQARDAEARKLAADLEIAMYTQPGYDMSASVWQALNAVTFAAGNLGSSRASASAGVISELDGKAAQMKDRALVEARRLTRAALA